MTGKQIRERSKNLETPILEQIDKALGLIHEHFEEIYEDCAFVTWQSINTSELFHRGARS